MNPSAGPILYTSGDTLPYWRYTGDRIKGYADKIGAKLVILPQRKIGNPQWVFFDALEHSLRDECVRAGWIDADILTGKHASSIFDPNWGNRLMLCQPTEPDGVHPKWLRAVNSGNWGVPNPRPYASTAIAAWTPGKVADLVEWFNAGAKTERFPGLWGDQEILALACWELDLPYHFFPADLHGGYKRTLLSNISEMIHAGGGNKCDKLQKILPHLELAETQYAT